MSVFLCWLMRHHPQPSDTTCPTCGCLFIGRWNKGWGKANR